LQTTEDLVTRLKRELNEAQRAKERRGWWQWLSGRRWACVHDERHFTFTKAIQAGQGPRHRSLSGL